MEVLKQFRKQVMKFDFKMFNGIMVALFFIFSGLDVVALVYHYYNIYGVLLGGTIVFALYFGAYVGLALFASVVQEMGVKMAVETLARAMEEQNGKAEEVEEIKA